MVKIPQQNQGEQLTLAQRVGRARELTRTVILPLIDSLADAYNRAADRAPAPLARGLAAPLRAPRVPVAQRGECLDDDTSVEDFSLSVRSREPGENEASSMSDDATSDSNETSGSESSRDTQSERSRSRSATSSDDDRSLRAHGSSPDISRSQSPASLYESPEPESESEASQSEASQSERSESDTSQSGQSQSEPPASRYGSAASRSASPASQPESPASRNVSPEARAASPGPSNANEAIAGPAFDPAGTGSTSASRSRSGSFRLPRVAARQATHLPDGQLGLFAEQRIPRNTVVGWYTGKVYETREELDAAHARYGDKLCKETSYVFEVPKTDAPGDILYFIDANQPVVPGDVLCDTRLINHSANHNCVFRVRKCADAPHGYGIAVVAQQNITKNEELTVYYGKNYAAVLRECFPETADYDFRKRAQKKRPREAVIETPEETDEAMPLVATDDDAADAADATEEAAAAGMLMFQEVRVLRQRVNRVQAEPARTEAVDLMEILAQAGEAVEVRVPAPQVAQDSVAAQDGVAVQDAVVQDAVVQDAVAVVDPPDAREPSASPPSGAANARWNALRNALQTRDVAALTPLIGPNNKMPKAMRDMFICRVADDAHPADLLTLLGSLDAATTSAVLVQRIIKSSGSAEDVTEVLTQLAANDADRLLAAVLHENAAVLRFAVEFNREGPLSYLLQLASQHIADDDAVALICTAAHFCDAAMVENVIGALQQHHGKAIGRSEVLEAFMGFGQPASVAKYMQAVGGYEALSMQLASHRFPDPTLKKYRERLSSAQNHNLAAFCKDEVGQRFVQASDTTMARLDAIINEADQAKMLPDLLEIYLADALVRAAYTGRAEVIRGLVDHSQVGYELCSNALVQMTGYEKMLLDGALKHGGIETFRAAAMLVMDTLGRAPIHAAARSMGVPHASAWLRQQKQEKT